MTGRPFRILLATAGVAFGLACTGAAQAQGFIPMVIGNTMLNMSSNSGNGCGAGPEAFVDWRATNEPLIDGVVHTYADAMAAGDRRRARGVFRARDWMDASGAPQDPFQTSPFVMTGADAASSLRLTDLIMGGDYQSAQGRWENGEGDALRYATIDFQRDFWGRWKIKRLVLDDAAPDALPDRFCTYGDLARR